MQISSLRRANNPRPSSLPGKDSSRRDVFAKRWNVLLYPCRVALVHSLRFDFRDSSERNRIALPRLSFYWEIGGCGSYG